MPMIVQRVSTADAQGTRWRATPNAHRGKDQTITISFQKKRQSKGTSQEWLSFTPVNWISFRALQTPRSYLQRWRDVHSALKTALRDLSELLTGRRAAHLTEQGHLVWRRVAVPVRAGETGASAERSHLSNHLACADH